MKRAGIIAVVVIVISVIAWVLFSSQPPAANNNTATNNPTTEVDQTQSTFVTVTIKNSAYTPQNIKIKKGTMVRWVNEDDVRHNVVALDENDQRALPAQNELLGKGQKYEYTFETIGTFSYKCTPHPFMTGTVEVVD